MNPSIDFATRRYRDGFEWTDTLFGKGFTAPPRVENSSTSMDLNVATASTRVSDAYYLWRIPPFGVVAGGARTEVISAGGVKGDGLWLDGANDALVYTIPTQDPRSQTEMASRPWLTSLWLDARRDDLSVAQRVLTFPDGS